MIQLTDKHWAVALTNLGDDFIKIRILPADDKWMVPYLKYAYRSIYNSRRAGKDFYCGDEIPLEEAGTWQYLFTTKGATEEDLKQLDGVLQHNNFKEWFIDFCNRLTYFFTRKESFQSLLRSKGCDDNKNRAIILKQSDNG